MPAQTTRASRMRHIKNVHTDITGFPGEWLLWINVPAPDHFIVSAGIFDTPFKTKREAEKIRAQVVRALYWFRYGDK